MTGSGLFEDAAWRKSSRSQGQTQNCVEPSRAGEVVGVRDSKDPDGPHLVFGVSDLRGFVVFLRKGLV
jgi:Domain of unknown function (DUF397)